MVQGNGCSVIPFVEFTDKYPCQMIKEIIVGLDCAVGEVSCQTAVEDYGTEGLTRLHVLYFLDDVRTFTRAAYQVVMDMSFGCPKHINTEGSWDIEVGSQRHGERDGGGVVGVKRVGTGQGT